MLQEENVWWVTGMGPRAHKWTGESHTGAEAALGRRSVSLLVGQSRRQFVSFVSSLIS